MGKELYNTYPVAKAVFDEADKLLGFSFSKKLFETDSTEIMDTEITQAAIFLTKSLPEKCVVTFFRKELEQFVSENNLPVIGYLNSEVLDIPIYEYKYGTDKLCITMAFCGAPGAAVTIEELHAMGCEKLLSLFLRLEMRGHPIIIWSHHVKWNAIKKRLRLLFRVWSKWGFHLQPGKHGQAMLYTEKLLIWLN